MGDVKAILVVALVGGCAADIPLCADLGCQVAASGTKDWWSPCKEDVCYCTSATGDWRVPKQPEPTACSRVPCNSANACPAGMHAAFAGYSPPETAPAISYVCYCDPDHTVTVAE